MKKPKRIGTIIFYLINSIAVIWFLQTIASSFIGLLICVVWVYSFLAHIYNTERTYKELYVEKETYNNLLNDFLKISEENKILKERK